MDEERRGRAARVAARGRGTPRASRSARRRRGAPGGAAAARAGRAGERGEQLVGAELLPARHAQAERRGERARELRLRERCRRVLEALARRAHADPGRGGELGVAAGEQRGARAEREPVARLAQALQVLARRAPGRGRAGRARAGRLRRARAWRRRRAGGRPRARGRCARRRAAGRARARPPPRSRPPPRAPRRSPPRRTATGSRAARRRGPARPHAAPCRGAGCSGSRTGACAPGRPRSSSHFATSAGTARVRIEVSRSASGGSSWAE